MLDDAKEEEESGRDRRSTQSDAVQADLDRTVFYPRLKIIKYVGFYSKVFET